MQQPGLKKSLASPKYMKLLCLLSLYAPRSSCVFEYLYKQTLTMLEFCQTACELIIFQKQSNLGLYY